jgi:hypothetical protein
MEIFSGNGWGDYVLKEKFKLIKMASKESHVSHTHNFMGKIASLKDRLVTLDGKGEEEELSEDVIVELHGIT